MNGLDIVPRLLGQGLGAANDVVHAVLGAASSNVSKLLKELKGSFVPVGVYHMLMKGQLQIVDSSKQPQLLTYSLYELLNILWTAMRTQQDRLRCLSSHFMKEYLASLKSCFKSLLASGASDGLDCCLGMLSTPQHSQSEGEDCFPGALLRDLEQIAFGLDSRHQHGTLLK